MRSIRRRPLLLATAATTLAGPRVMAQPAPIRLAQSVPLSGLVAPFFEAILAGQRMALDEANATGGVRGRRVELSLIDDRYDPAATVANVRRLLDTQSPAAIVGLGNTAAVAQCLPLALQSQVPLIGPYTGSPGLRAQPHPFFFTTFASYVDELVQMVRALVGVGYKRHAVAYMDNEFGRGMLPALRQVAAAAGAEVVAAEAVAVDGGNAVEAVARLRPSAPHAVVAFAFGAAVVAVVKAQHAMLKTPIYALSVANSRAVIAALGAAGRGLAFTQLMPYP